jgi:hypothetical protein
MIVEEHCRAPSNSDGRKRLASAVVYDRAFVHAIADREGGIQCVFYF